MSPSIISASVRWGFTPTANIALQLTADGQQGSSLQGLVPDGGFHDAGSEASSIHSHRNNLLLAYSTVGLISCFAGTGERKLAMTGCALTARAYKFECKYERSNVLHQLNKDRIGSVWVPNHENWQHNLQKCLIQPDKERQPGVGR